MKQLSTSVLPAKLAEGCRHFEQWRSRQETRRRLPDHLWELAAELAREYGVSKIARILQLDYNRLKQRSRGSAFKNQSEEADRVHFFELMPDRGQPPLECTVECEQATRGKIRIQLKGANGAEVSALCGRLWPPER